MNDDQLRARLRDADPAASLPPADPDRVSDLLEDAMSHDTDTESRRDRHPRPQSADLAGRRCRGPADRRRRGVRAAARAGLPAPARGAGEQHRTALGLTLPDEAAAGRCMTPTPASLGRAEVAFEGEVASIADGRVVLRPTQFYAGGPADRVEVAQASQSRQDLILGVRFEEGSRYLVAANGDEVMVCGFSGAYDEERADLYAEAFAG